MLSLETVLSMTQKTADHIASRNKAGHAYVSRAELNSKFKATSDMKVSELLSEAIINLLHYGWLHKRFDDDSGTVHFWATRRLIPNYETSLVPTAVAQREIQFPDLYFMYLNPNLSDDIQHKFYSSKSSSEDSQEAETATESSQETTESVVTPESKSKSTLLPLPSPSHPNVVVRPESKLSGASLLDLHDYRRIFGDTRAPKERQNLFCRIVKSNPLPKETLEFELRQFFSNYVVNSTFKALLDAGRLSIQKEDEVSKFVATGFVDAATVNSLPKFPITPPQDHKTYTVVPDTLQDTAATKPMASASDLEMFARYTCLSPQDKALINLMVCRLEMK